jgi:FkbM family methyltransferase
LGQDINNKSGRSRISCEADGNLRSILIPWNLFNSIGASPGGSARVDFASGGAMLHAVMPSDQLWISIKDVLVYENYEFLDRFRLSRLPPRATVLDAGAFVGLYSLKASTYAKKVVALEPSPQNYRYLASNLRLNASQNVEAHEVALSSTTGIAPFSEAGTVSALDKDGHRLVRTTTLDDVVDSLGRVDLLKMDIEGAEYEVLAASKTALGNITKITAEVHVQSDAHRLGLKVLVSTLRESGFEVQIFSSPFQSMTYGMTKPWNCALKRYNGGSATLYRVLLSVIYGTGPLARVLKQSMEVGSEGLLFAHRG